MAKGDQSGGYMPGLYQASVNQTGKDYDSIMQQYQQLAHQVGPGNSNSSSYNSSTPQQNSLNFSPITPSQMNPYSSIAPSLAANTPAPDYSYLQNMVKTGGFSEEDKGNIRARDTAATTSIYDSANRGLSRQKALSGGYAPNAAAASAKMARESSNQISGINARSNANIAEMVQRGQLQAMGLLAPLQSHGADAQNQNSQFNANATNQANQFNSQGMNQVNQFNANAMNSANQFNAQMPLQYGQFNAGLQNQQNQQQQNSFNNQLAGIQGQQSLYGTTPGLASTFGNQVLNAANTVNSFPPVIQGYGNTRNNSPWGRSSASRG